MSQYNDEIKVGNAIKDAVDECLNVIANCQDPTSGDQHEKTAAVAKACGRMFDKIERTKAAYVAKQKEKRVVQNAAHSFDGRQSFDLSHNGDDGGAGAVLMSSMGIGVDGAQNLSRAGRPPAEPNALRELWKV